MTVSQGAHCWEDANVTVVFSTPNHHPIEVRFDTHDVYRPMCAIALLENVEGAFSAMKIVAYFSDHALMDRRFHWTPGVKS